MATADKPTENSALMRYLERMGQDRNPDVHRTPDEDMQGRAIMQRQMLDLARQMERRLQGREDGGQQEHDPEMQSLATGDEVADEHFEAVLHR